MQYNKQQILEIVNHQLLVWIRKDETVKDAVVELVNLKFETKKVSEDKFTILLNELQKDREAQTKKWDEAKIEDKRKWDEWIAEDKKKWDEWRDENSKIWKEFCELKKVDSDLKTELSKMDQKLFKFGSRWGKHIEITFANAIKGILKDLRPDLQILHYDEYDSEGMVYGWPSSVEIDFIIKNDKTYLVEISTRVGKGDISIYKRKIKFYEKYHDTKIHQLVVISPDVTLDVETSAANREITLFTYAEEVNL